MDGQPEFCGHSVLRSTQGRMTLSPFDLGVRASRPDDADHALVLHIVPDLARDLRADLPLLRLASAAAAPHPSRSYAPRTAGP